VSRQLASVECSTVKTSETILRTGPDAPGKFAEAKNWVPALNGRAGTSRTPWSSSIVQGTVSIYGDGVWCFGSSKGTRLIVNSVRPWVDGGSSIEDQVILSESHCLGVEKLGENALTAVEERTAKRATA
jgi:hypothetical protein